MARLHLGRGESLQWLPGRPSQSVMPTARLLAEARIIVNFGLQMRKDYQILIFSLQLLKAVGSCSRPLLFVDLEAMFRNAHRLVAKPNPEITVFGHGGIDHPVL